LFAVACDSGEVKVVQHSAEVPIDIGYCVEARSTASELNKSVLHEILCARTIIFGQAHGPGEKSLVAFQE